jgi:hypothetical protein
MRPPDRTNGTAAAKAAPWQRARLTPAARPGVEGLAALAALEIQKYVVQRLKAGPDSRARLCSCCFRSVCSVFRVVCSVRARLSSGSLGRSSSRRRGSSGARSPAAWFGAIGAAPGFQSVVGLDLIFVELLDGGRRQSCEAPFLSRARRCGTGARCSARRRAP